MSRGDQLGRQWRIIQTLLASRCGKSAADLAEELGCTTRTVYRDLDALQIAGFPVLNERADGRSVWALLDVVRQQVPIPFSLPELMALYFSCDMVKSLHDTVFSDALESLFQKIRSTLPPESAAFLSNIQKTLQVSPKQYKDYGTFRDIITQVHNAAIQKKSVEIDYFTMSRKARTVRLVDPYRIWLFSGTFYLVGYCHLRGEVRTFVIDRIRSVKETGRIFSVPENFTMEELLGPSLGVFQGKAASVRVRFDASVAGYIGERTWHESQQLYTGQDGSVVFEAELAVTDELKSWILSWGMRAEVLEPQSLRDELREEAAGMLAGYERAASGVSP